MASRLFKSQMATRRNAQLRRRVILNAFRSARRKVFRREQNIQARVIEGRREQNIQLRVIEVRKQEPTRD